jgi:hypothetical protein
MFVLLSLLFVLADVPARPLGNSETMVRAGTHDLKIFLYRPVAKPTSIVLVFHGTNRNASEYCDWAKVIGDRLQATVAAPLFDKDNFPVDRYQMGGLRVRGKYLPKEEWTWSLVPEIADRLRQQEGAAELPFSLIGHSAGGQFLNRLSGFVNTGATRIVASNPGTLLFPDDMTPFPYGFGELPEGLGGEAGLKRYLAQPLTLYLGTADTIQDKYFPKSRLANLQGASRYERGKNAFQKAETLAKEKNWPFHWQLVEAEGVGHDSTKMFAHENCLKALAATTTPSVAR